MILSFSILPLCRGPGRPGPGWGRACLLFLLPSFHSGCTAGFLLHLQFALPHFTVLSLNASDACLHPDETKVQKYEEKNGKLIIPFKAHMVPKTRQQAQWHEVDVEQTFTESLNKMTREVTTPVAFYTWTSFHSSLSPSSTPLFPIFTPGRATVSSKF